MANYDWDTRDDRVFYPKSVPSTERIGLHIADRGEHKTPRGLWFVVDGARVVIRLDSLPSLWAPQLYMNGFIVDWKKEPECARHYFSLSWKTIVKGERRINSPVLTVHGVTPRCVVCKGTTNRHGWTFECPRKECQFEVQDPNAPEKTPEPPMCMSCGTQMTRAGSIHACGSCGSTSSS